MGNKRFKKHKNNLVFDENERRDFLTGFQKRKAERRLKAKEKLEKQLKEEKKLIKQRQKERLQKLYENQRTVPEVEHLVEPVTYELPSHLVKITTLDANEIAGKLGLTMGIKKSQVEEEEEEDVSGDEREDIAKTHDEDDTGKSRSELIVEAQKQLKKQRIKDLKSSQAFQTQQKMAKKKDLKKSQVRRKMIKREMKNAKLKSKMSKSRKKLVEKKRKVSRKAEKV